MHKAVWRADKQIIVTKSRPQLDSNIYNMYIIYNIFFIKIQMKFSKM